MKTFSDYNNQYNHEETIRLISKIKHKVISIFENMFNLISIDPKYIIDRNNPNFEPRNIVFDNFETQEIYAINPSMNIFIFQQMNKMHFEINEGLICYNPLIHRDFVISSITSSYEYIFNLHIKQLISEINEENIKKIVINLIDELNKMNITSIKSRPIPKIKNLSVDSLLKQYPLLKKESILNEACFKYKALLVFGSNGNNKQKFNLIEDKIGVYGETVATLYVYNNINNTVFKLLTIYSTASKSYLMDQIVNNELKADNYGSILNDMPDAANQIGIEFYFSQYLVYILSKFCLDEIIYV